MRAWFNMFFVDHGFFRFFYLNFRRIDDDAYRAAQPGPRQFRRIRRRGVRTIVNLRGGRQFGSYPLEREACARLGLAYEEITLRSREAPSLQTLQDAADLLERVEYPVLFHCKSGADRSGLMAALYLMLKAKRPASDAKRMLALRYGHVRQSKTGVLDAFVDAFAEAEREARAAGRDLSLMEWARGDYDPKALTANFRATSWASWLIDTVLNRE
ncbi:MAG: sulfur transferase domain-containing protein [Pseudomonadota bacterium]